MLIQLLLRAAAAAVLGDVDLSLRGTDVDEVAQVADALGGRRVGRTVGQGEAETAGAVEDRRVADVEPGHALVGGGEDPADGRADDDVLAVDRVDGEVGAAHERPLRVGGRIAAAGLEQAEGLGRRR